jgi:hypothetical protein
MEVSVDVELGLKAIRDTFKLLLNPKGRAVGGRSFDVMGNPREGAYEARWELWDKDVSGREYKVVTLEDRDGGFMPPDQRLVDFINLINPERYGGEVEKMIDALVDSPNQYASTLGDLQYEQMIEHLADVSWTLNRPSNVTR